MRKRQIFIELTSLLDVILIILFILLMQAKTSTAEAVESAAQAEGSVQALQEELSEVRREREEYRAEADALGEKADALQRQLLSENLVLDNTVLMTVSVDPDGNIRAEVAGAERTVISYSWMDDTYAMNRLRALTLERVKNNNGQAVFLVFQYDRTRIYQAEYTMIETIIQEVKQEARAREISLSVLELDIHEG